MAHTPKPWTLLHDDDGESSIVVPEGASVTEAVLELVEQVTGDRFEPDNPAIVDAVAGLEVETWRSTTWRWREGEGVTEDDWWAPDGDGRRTIEVVSLNRSVHALADAAAEVAGG